jgi:glycosyltransferase involved in cell wall biosynthesis
MIKLSICIPTYNRSNYLKEALESVLLSSKGFEDKLEIIVSDNASTDNTTEVVKQYQQKYELIRYSRNEVNVVDKNFFIAAGLSRGEYIWVFADDDKMNKDAIKTIFDKITKGYNLVICNYSLWDKEFASLVKALWYEVNCDIEFNDPNMLMEYFGFKLQYLSSIVVKREVFFTAGENEASLFHAYGCSFSYALYCGMIERTRAILVANPIVMYRGFNSDLVSIEKWYNCFCTGSALLFDVLRKKGFSLSAIRCSEKGILFDFIARDISHRRRSHMTTRGIWRVTYASYKHSVYFWAIIPLLMVTPLYLINLLKSIKMKMKNANPLNNGLFQ